MATLSAHTASPPPQSQTPAGLRRAWHLSDPPLPAPGPRPGGGRSGQDLAFPTGHLPRRAGEGLPRADPSVSGRRSDLTPLPARSSRGPAREPRPSEKTTARLYSTMARCGSLTARQNLRAAPPKGGGCLRIACASLACLLATRSGEPLGGAAERTTCESWQRSCGVAGDPGTGASRWPSRNAQGSTSACFRRCSRCG
jgi:hypothetical protein